MKTFRVGAVQMNSLRDDLDHNIEVHLQFIRKASEEGCDLVVFPELSATAHYGDAKVTQFAEEAGKGPVYAVMEAAAREHNLFIGYGFCEEAHGTFYNSYAIAGPDGLVGLQRKIHASGDEYFCFRMGRRLVVFNLGFCKAGVLVCYDSNFFEAWRVLALGGAEVLLLPHASRSGKGKRIEKKEQRKKLRARLENLPGDNGTYARANAVFAVFNNQADFNGHSTHGGGIFVLNPLGRVIEKGPPILEDTILYAELNPDLLLEARKSSHCTLKMRRPEIYGKITEMI